MTQFIAVAGKVHTPVVSLHVSVVHGAASLHVVPVAHVPEPLHVPQPATEASSHRVPVRGVHDVALAAGVQISHGLPGLTVADA